MWRYANREIRRKKAAKEQAAFPASGAPDGGASGFSATSGAAGAITAAIATVLPVVASLSATAATSHTDPTGLPPPAVTAEAAVDLDELRRKRLVRFGEYQPPPVSPCDDVPHNHTSRKRTREPDEMRSSIGAGGWACSVCTFVNQNTEHLSCSMCGTERT